MWRRSSSNRSWSQRLRLSFKRSCQSHLRLSRRQCRDRAPSACRDLRVLRRRDAGRPSGGRPGRSIPTPADGADPAPPRGQLDEPAPCGGVLHGHLWGADLPWLPEKHGDQGEQRTRAGRRGAPGHAGVLRSGPCRRDHAPGEGAEVLPVGGGHDLRRHLPHPGPPHGRGGEGTAGPDRPDRGDRPLCRVRVDPGVVPTGLSGSPPEGLPEDGGPRRHGRADRGRPRIRPRRDLLPLAPVQARDHGAVQASEEDFVPPAPDPGVAPRRHGGGCDRGDLPEDPRGRAGDVHFRALAAKSRVDSSFTPASGALGARPSGHRPDGWSGSSPARAPWAGVKWIGPLSSRASPWRRGRGRRD